MTLTVASWVLLTVAALGIGFAKTAVGGVATVSVALFAMVMPAKESTGTMLVLLLVGDVIATWTYRRCVDWRLLLRLIVPVAAGVLIGVAFLTHVSNGVVKQTIGWIVLTLTAITIWQLWRARWRTPAPQPAPARVGATTDADSGDVEQRPAGTDGTEPAAELATAAVAATTLPRRRPVTLLKSSGFGSLAGFTTMVANAGGPVMNLYLLSAQLPMLRFLGTNAWFFFTVNLFKLPFSIGIGAISVHDFITICLPLTPLVIVGALVGRWCIDKINQDIFTWLVVASTLVSAVVLVV